jgi:hypothetical protein
MARFTEPSLVLLFDLFAACNPSYLGGGDWEDCCLALGLRPYLKKNN